VERKGISLHSGKVSKVKLCPGFAGQGRYFDFRSNLVPASVEFAQVSPLCTTLCKDGLRIRTVEHLLSALEAVGVDNCRIEIENLDDQGDDVEVRRLLNVNLLIDFACEKINLDYRMY
jgi:UDP-3-O-[3-hydroxymyristoyl] N-acetylglucosamine deacetylase